MTRLGRLVRDRRARDAEAVTIIDGPRPLSTAIDCDAVVEAVFARPDRYAEVVEITGPEVEVLEVDSDILDRLADSETPQGVLAVVERVDLDVDDVVDRNRVVVIDRVQDPGNAGAIVRTAAAAGFDAVVAGTGTADLWSPRAVRASAGTVFALDVVRRVGVAAALATSGSAGHRR
ncbi:MAG: TrmH family RNA methyltransferase, partial [Actinomycetota bacterium]|nr:TrmH family RNA methyltransferase [Actinomycetota bacterium]